MQASEKSGLAAKKLASVKRREERRWVPVSIFSNTSVYPLPCQLPEKLFLVSKCQMSKCQTVRCRRDSYAHHVYVTLRAQSPAIDVSVDINYQNWPIIGYASSWYTAMKHWKQCLPAKSPALLYRLSPAPTRFSNSFSGFAFPAILEPGTVCLYGLWCFHSKNYCCRFFCLLFMTY